MTVRVTTLKGLDAGLYYVEQLPYYYLDANEPRGRWLGRGAAALDLSGTIGDEAFLALMAGMDPARPDRHLGRRYGETSVRGHDVTCSAPKSVSVLFALGDEFVRNRVLRSHDRAVRALMSWIEDHAHTRYRIGGEVAVVDAKGIVAAMFRQHTSRALDPQIHTHLVIPNRVMSPDGRWLALDARLIKRDQRTLSAMYHAALRAEMNQALGVRWRTPENGIAEMADIPDVVLTEYSYRTDDIRRRIDVKLDRFVANMDRDPTPRERWKLEREAVLDTRPSKEKHVDAATLHAEWRERAWQLDVAPEEIVAEAVKQQRPRQSIPTDELSRLIGGAIEAIGEKQSTWRPTELQRELGGLFPTDVGADAVAILNSLDDVADAIAKKRCVDISKSIPPDSLLRKDGRPVTEGATDRAFTTQAILDQELALLEWAARRISANDLINPAAIDRSDVDLNIAQAEAAARVAGDSQLVLIVGPAGTGKTTALRPAVAQLRSQGRPVFGVAPSAAAAEVLQHETGVAADTLDKLLIEHRLNRPPDHQYDLPAGATVIIDEAGMMSTPKLAELAALADQKQWRVVLVGDPLQFSAVGRGGMFELFVDTNDAVELDRVHRFDNDWERDASLRLRRGDVEVAEVYDHQGRLHGGSVQRMRQQAVARWWTEREAGRTALLMSPTNETVVDLNLQCQRQRLRTGELHLDGATALAGRYVLFVGDQVATRKNDRGLLTDRGQMVRNRAEWTVRAIHRDLSVTVEGASGTVRLPREYVVDHVDLAYARTGAGAQGRTVDAGILFLDRATDVRNLYVPMTRGRSTNEVFVATEGEQTALDVIAQSIATDWIDRPALARQAELKQANNVSPEIERPMLALRGADTANRSLAAAVHGRAAEHVAGRSSEDQLHHVDRNPTREILDRWSGRSRKPTAEHERAADGYFPDKPWEEMDEMERIIAEMYHYEPIGDSWRHVSEAPQQSVGRELPGMDLPGL